MIVIWSPQFAAHTPPPGHPERPERAAVFGRVVEAFRLAAGRIDEPAEVSTSELARVHTADYLADMEGREGRTSMIDADTFTSPESVGVARLAAGAACHAARHSWEHREPAFAFVRPPGHHAEPDRAMGFCLYNNIAVAAAALRSTGVNRVAIIDIDVHHGNGTQAAFYEDPSVFYASTHQWPYYPGTGAAAERGSGEGEGTTLNVPLPAGTGDNAFLAAYTTVILPALSDFGPEILLVSAGFDAHWQDPLGGLRVTTDGYAAVVEALRNFADQSCEGRIALVTEGGYDLDALEDCLAASIGVLT